MDLPRLPRRRPAGSALGFEETLTALLDFMGESISVHVRLPGSRNAPGLMLVTGVLHSAPEVVEQQGGEGEHFFFRVGDSANLAGFFLDPNRFRGAGWEEGRLVIALVNDVDIVVAAD